MASVGGTVGVGGGGVAALYSGLRGSVRVVQNYNHPRHCCYFARLWGTTIFIVHGNSWWFQCSADEGRLTIDDPKQKMYYKRPKLRADGCVYNNKWISVKLKFGISLPAARGTRVTSVLCLSGSCPRRRLPTRITCECESSADRDSFLACKHTCGCTMQGLTVLSLTYSHLDPMPEWGTRIPFL